MDRFDFFLGNRQVRFEMLSTVDADGVTVIDDSCVVSGDVTLGVEDSGGSGDRLHFFDFGLSEAHPLNTIKVT